MKKVSVIGEYGSWAASLNESALPELSFRRDEFKSVATWRQKARAKTLELLSMPPDSAPPEARVEERLSLDGLDVERLSWRLPYGQRTEAVFLKPAGARGKLPAMLALHDHGGFKYFGYSKVADAGPNVHPLVVEHRADAYAGLAWPNELARRGWAVLCHDAFAFGSRRVRYENVIDELVTDREEPVDDDADSIRAYNEWAGEHESVLAKSLFCAGTTWPGVFLSEDMRALDYLLSREDVDASRVACGGLSGGGLRTAYLAGLDERIKAAVCVGFMSTWKDFLLNKCWTHTWMLYAPLLSKYLDFPEVLGLRAPLATLVQSCTEDPLYTLAEMKKADVVLREVFEKAGAPENYSTLFYPGGHKFDREMQSVAFDWLENVLVG